MSIGDDTHAWRNDLPHMQNVGKTYFLTFVTHQRQELSPPERDIVLSCVRRAHRGAIFLHAAVIMPDHVHLLFSLNDRATLPKLMGQLKSIPAHQIGRHIWQRDSFDRIMRSDEDLRAKAKYIVNNPVRRGLVRCVDDYPWIYRWWIDDGGEGAAAPLNAATLSVRVDG